MEKHQPKKFSWKKKTRTFALLFWQQTKYWKLYKTTKIHCQMELPSEPRNLLNRFLLCLVLKPAVKIFRFLPLWNTERTGTIGDFSNFWWKKFLSLADNPIGAPNHSCLISNGASDWLLKLYFGKQNIGSVTFIFGVIFRKVQFLSLKKSYDTNPDSIKIVQHLLSLDLLPLHEIDTQ